jgi:hypothetical protein
MHRIGEPVARMVADRDFEHAPRCIDVAAHDSKAGASARDRELLRDVRARRDRLNVLSHSRNRNARKLLQLLEDGALRGFDLLRRFGKVAVDIGVGDRDRLVVVGARPDSSKMAPISPGSIPICSACFFGSRALPRSVNSNRVSRAYWRISPTLESGW